MKRQNTFIGYLLIGIGIYFLLRMLQIPIITDFYSWPTLIIIIGIALLLHGHHTKEHQGIFFGTIILGIGIHLHGLAHYTFWINHWAVYLLIIGIAYIIRFLYTKKGLFMGIILIGFSLLFIYSVRLPSWFDGVYELIDYVRQYWPVVIIVIGIYLLTRKK